MNNSNIERIFLTEAKSIDTLINSYVDCLIDTLLSTDYDINQVNTVSSLETGGIPL